MTAGPEELWISTRGMAEGRGCGCGRMSKVRSTCFGYAELMMRTPGQLAPLECIWVRLAEMKDAPRSITMRSKSNSWGYRLHTQNTKTVVGLAKMFQA